MENYFVCYYIVSILGFVIFIIYDSLIGYGVVSFGWLLDVRVIEISYGYFLRSWYLIVLKYD